MESAVVVRVNLPDGLDQLRRRCVSDASLGMPAHVTLLYPFVDPPALSPDVRIAVEAIAAAHISFQSVLSGPFQWPDTVYAAAGPQERFLELHLALAKAFPDYPVYRRPGFALVPHVTIAEGTEVGNADVLEHSAWASLPCVGLVDALDVMALDVMAQGEDGLWRTLWTAPLATQGF